VGDGSASASCATVRFHNAIPLVDALPLLRGAELFEHEFEASLAWIRGVVVVVHTKSVPGGGLRRSSK
jgi:hypothetical protein